MSEYHVHGKVLSKTAQKGVSALRVEVWDKDPIQDDLVGSDVTDQQGVFSVTFDASYFKELFFDREPDVYFKVFRGKWLLTSTEPSVMWNIKEAERLVTLFVNVSDNDDNDTPSMDRPVNKANSFIPPENINVIYEAIAGVWPDGKQQQKQRTVIASLECEAATVGLLWNDARDYLHGDTLAGNRLLAQLNTLVLNTAAFPQSGPTDPSPQGQPISGQASFIPNPRLPGIPCLFPPSRLSDIYFGVARLADLLPDDPREFVDLYFDRVQSLVEQLAPLEMLHGAAQRVLDGYPGAEDYFAASLGCIGDVPGAASSRQPIAMTSGGAPDSRLPQHPFLIFDGCRAERWQETADSVQCFQQLQAAPRYEIDDIVNLTTGISRRGCVGHEIEIQGSNLGDRGEITFGRSSVITTLEWTDSSIRFTLPADARSGDIGICIDPEIDGCVRFSSVCRLPAADTDHSFEVVPAPEIDSFSLVGPAFIGRIEDTTQYEAEACTDATVIAVARHAEQVIIRNGTGTVVYDSGVGELRTIDTGALETPLVLSEIQEDVILTLEVSNLCGTISRVVELSIYNAIHLTAGSRVRAGESVDVTLRISCPSPDGGTSVTLSSSLPTAFALPDGPVVIAEGETTTTVTLGATATCAEIEISANAPGHRGDSVIILIFDIPTIIEVTPLERSACSSFSLDIRGDCFDPTAAENNVLATNGTETVSLSVMDIRFLDPTNRGRNAVLEVRGENLSPGSWELFVESNGLTGTRFAAPLVIRPVPAQIHNFSSNLLRITPCVNNSVELRWEVSHVERVEISSGGGSVVSRSYGPTCTRRSDTARVTIREATSYRLSAFPIGGGTPVSSSLRVEEIATPQAEEVRVENWTRGRHSLNTHSPSGSRILRPANASIMALSSTAKGSRYGWPIATCTGCSR